MKDAVICEPIRTPVGRYGGVFRDIPAVDLAEVVLRELIKRTRIDAAAVDDVIFGQCYPNGEAPAIGRVAALDAGLGMHFRGLQVDRRCGSGLQAVLDGAMRIQTGAADLVIAGGAESMSQAEHYALGARFGLRGDSSPLWDRIARGRITSGGKHHPVPGGMLETAENLRREFAISRKAQDELACLSHAARGRRPAERRFRRGDRAGARQGPGGVKNVAVDEHPRADVTMEQLSELTAGAPRVGSGIDGDGRQRQRPE